MFLVRAHVADRSQEKVKDGLEKLLESFGDVLETIATTKTDLESRRVLNESVAVELEHEGCVGRAAAKRRM